MHCVLLWPCRLVSDREGGYLLASQLPAEEILPAACAACMPARASSRTTQEPGSTPTLEAAVRKMEGSGLLWVMSLPVTMASKSPSWKPMALRVASTCSRLLPECWCVAHEVDLARGVTSSKSVQHYSCVQLCGADCTRWKPGALRCQQNLDQVNSGGKACHILICSWCS